MAKTKISEFSAIPANNTDIDSINIAEGCAPSGINDAIRELMAQLKDWQSGTSNDPYVVGSSGSLTLNQGTANGVPYLNGSKVVTSGSALTFNGTNFATTGSVTSAGSSNSGNLAFTGTGNRITGDFSNATDANRVAIQTSTTNGGTRLNIISNGTGTASSLDVFESSDPTNSSVLRIRQSNVESQIQSSITGTGSYRPMTFYTGGSERMRLDSSGNLGIGTSSPNGRLQVTGGTTNASNLATSYSAAAFTLVPKSTSGFSLAFGSGPSDFPYIQMSAAGSVASDMTLQPYGGNVGIGTASPGQKLDVSGTARFGSTYTSTYIANNGATNTSSQIGDNATFGAGTAYGINSSSAYLYAQTAGTERMRIDSSGNLLVGTTTSHARIAARSTVDSATIIRGDGETAGYYGTVILANSSRGATTGYNLYDGYANGGLVFRVYGNGNVINTNNSYGAISDSKLKENIVDASPKLADMMQVKVRNYNLIGDTTKQLGVVAQELETVFPAMIDETVDRDAEGNELGTTTKQVKYSVFVPMLIKAIQEQQAIITALTARVEALEGQA